MRRFLAFAALAVALASIVAGAVLSILPALVLGLVTLFYDSAGGVLILLGSLINLLPHPVVPTSGSSPLPEFQMLRSDAAFVLLRASIATVACAVAGAMMVARDRRPWIVSGLCCGAAAVAGGWEVALVLIPAIVVCVAGAARRRLTV